MEFTCRNKFLGSTLLALGYVLHRVDVDKYGKPQFVFITVEGLQQAVAGFYNQTLPAPPQPYALFGALMDIQDAMKAAGC